MAFGPAAAESTQQPIDPAVRSGIALNRLLRCRRDRLLRDLNGRMDQLQSIPSAAALAAQPQKQHDDRELVHHLRTGLRRLRTLADAFPDQWSGPSAQGLRRLARWAGNVRDLDVLLLALQAHPSTLSARERGRLQHVIRRLELSRGTQRQLLAQQLANARGPLALAGQSPEPLSAAEVEAAMPLLRAAPVRQLAVLRLHPGWGNGQRPHHGSEAERHQHALRKTFKQLRYQLELFEGLLPDLHDRLITLKRTQDSLGLLQDLTVWRRLLKQHLKGGFRSTLPELAASWRLQADAAWGDWIACRAVWLDSRQGLEAWQRWLLDQTHLPEPPLVSAHPRQETP
jgi:CHAD domain-containing protein